MVRLLIGSSLKRRLRDRKLLELDELFANSQLPLSVTKEQWVERWSEIALILEIDPRCLRPTDRFDKELLEENGLLGVRDNLDSLAEWAEFHLSANQHEVDLGELNCLSELMQKILIARKCERLN